VWMAGRFMGGATPLIVYALVYTTVEGDDFNGVTTVHWRHGFLIFGTLGVLWCLVFWWWFRDRPEDKESVNDAELALINAGRQGAPSAAQLPPRPVVDTPDTAVQRHVVSKNPFAGVQPPVIRAEGLSHAGVPWRRLLTSVNLWMLCLMYFCASYGWYFNITYLPDYLKTTYGFDKDKHGLLEAGLITGSPLLAGAVACLLGGILTDVFIRRTGNCKWGRRLFGVVGHGVCALCYFASMFASNVYLFMLAIALAAFWNDLTMGAAWASCLDIGRKYAGVVSGCMNTIGNLGGALAGAATGVVLDLFNDGSAVNAGAWHINFILFTVVYVIAAMCWLRFDATKPLVHED
jgi:ACS family glucarate transporter-like MFS transporter